MLPHWGMFTCVLGRLAQSTAIGAVCGSTWIKHARRTWTSEEHMHLVSARCTARPRNTHLLLFTLLFSLVAAIKFLTALGGVTEYTVSEQSNGSQETERPEQEDE